MSPLVDTRPEAEFLAGHARGAASFPVEELPRHTHELPPADVALQVCDADPGRAARAAEFLRRRGHTVALAPFDLQAQTERGPARVRLWRPTPFLVEALEFIRAKVTAPVADRPRHALDLACGSGRDAVYLALQGYDVEAIDVLPDALDRAADLARRCGVVIRTEVRDLEREPALPAGHYALVTVFRYLQRSLFPSLRAALAPGGYVVYETFHERNRQTGMKPRNPDHLLQTGELAAAFAGFDVLVAADAVERDGRYFSRLLARRRA